MVSGYTVLFLIVFTQVLSACPPNVTIYCNDGNNRNGDGCDSNCQIEDGWKCPAAEVIGPCVCQCIKPTNPPTCGCDWVSTGCGAPLPTMADFARIGARFEPTTQSKMLAQGIKFNRCGCNKNVYYTEKDKTAACPNNAGLSTNEGLVLKLASVPTEGLDYDQKKVTWVDWVGTPLRTVTSLERLAFECPPGKVPTEIYFDKAGCNAASNVSSFAWITKWTAQQYPGCMAGSRSYNDGLSMVAVCRPDDSLARNNWMWLDAGFASPIVNPSDLEHLGGLCPSGYAMTGAYFNSAGCGETLRWNQALTQSQVTPKCSANQKDAKGKPLLNGLNLRLKCTQFGRNIFECGPNAPHSAFPCDVNAQCLPSYGGTRCVCNSGYEGNGRNGTCFPINVCVDDENACAAKPGGICSSTGPGTFSCACAPGYTGDGKTCKPAARVISTTDTVFPRFRAQCMFGLTGSGITGSIDFSTQMNTNGDPLGTIINVNVGGTNLPRVVRWDIRESSVDTENNALDSCWDAGKPYVGAGKDGLTAKYGKLRNMKVYDPDVHIWGPSSVAGRSIVLEEEDGDYLDCCTIHIDLDDSPYTPAKPIWKKTTSGASCKFADGRAVFFTQNEEYVGTRNAGLEDLPGGHSVGSYINVNPPTVIADTLFATPDTALPWKQATTGNPAREQCPGTSLWLLGGQTGQTTKSFMDYTIPTTYRYFRSVTIELTYHAMGSWENEWALVQLIVPNPDMTFPVWSQLYNGNAGCSATSNRFNVKVTYPMARSQNTATIRITSNLDTTGEYFAISHFKVTLEPVNDVYTLRNRAFSGSSDLSQWSKVSNVNGVLVKTPPAVGPCTTGGATYSLLGGEEVLKTGDYLEYRKINVPSFTRLQVVARLWFLGNWQGQSIVIEMINEAQGEVVPMWSSTGQHRPTSNLNCDNSGFKDYYVDLNIDQSFKRSCNVAYIRIRSVGTLNQASWAFSSWQINALPTGSSIDIYFDRFRAQRAPGWQIVQVAPLPALTRDIALSDFRQCSFCQSIPGRTWGHDRVVEGYRGRQLRYTQTGTPAFTQAVLTFEYYFLDTWDGEFGKLNVNGVGEVWSRSWGGTRIWGYRQRLCTHYANRGYGTTVSESVLVTWQSVQTSISMTFSCTLDQDQTDESYAVGALRITLLPNVEEMQTGTEDVDSTRWKWGRVYWTGPSQIYESTRAPTNNFGGLPRCTVPAGLYPAVKMQNPDDRIHNLLGYRGGNYQEVRYTVTTNRPYTKALVRFYQWWIDDWDGEWSWVRHKTTNLVIPNSPMRYVFKETYAYQDAAYSASFCASSGGTWVDEVRYRALWLIEPQTTTTIDLFWGSTLNSPIDDESYAESRLAYTTFAEIPNTRIMTYTANQFSDANKRAAWSTSGGTAAYTICGGEYAIYGYSTASNYVRYRIPTQSVAFKTWRIHFRYWYMNTWDGERSYLYATSDSGEWINVMRDDWTHGYIPPWNMGGNDLQYRENGYRATYAWCSGGNYGRSSLDYYVDYYVEVSFAKATKTAELIWSNNLDQGWPDESFAVSHVTLDIYPIQYGFNIETSSFVSTGNTLEGFQVLSGNRWADATVVTPCGVSPKHELVGGRTRLSPLEKMKFESKASEAPTTFSKVYIYFRYWFLPTWNINSKATLAVAEKGQSTQATWEMIFPFPLSQQVNTADNPLNCNINQNMYKDVVVAVQFPRPIREISVTWGIAAPVGFVSPRFAISAFKLDYETPFPDWAIQTACVAAPWRPQDGIQLDVQGQWMGLGDMARKHGSFVNKPEFIDNTIILHSGFNIIGKKVALYPPGKTTGAICCDIVGNGINYAPPRLPPAMTAGCVWRNKDTEGYIGFRTASSAIRNGVQLSVFAKFYGTEATQKHSYSINYRGFGQPELVANPKCPATLTGGIYGTGQEPDDLIGPSSQTYGFGNAPFPGTPGSTRARIGDLSGKHGLLSNNMVKEILIQDGQVTLSGPFSVVGRSVVINGINGNPIGCCTIGFGPVGGPDRGFDYFDNLGNFTNPNQVDIAPEDPFAVVDPEGDLATAPAGNYPYWSAGRIATLAIGLAAAVALVGAIAASAMGGGGAAAGDVGDGYVAM